jgi:tRNA(Ile)-lysidine synthase
VPRVAVATSGGRDSTALLHATVQACRALGAEVLALHVHHGLQEKADEWPQRVKQQAQRWGAGFDCRRLGGKPARGESIEAWARKGRYAALAEMAQAAGCDLVLLAHHRRDQAETWLLQALRGGTQAGLSAMPRIAQRVGLTWARPWLDQPREAVEAYVRRHRISFVEDPSNEDPRYARNRLRLQVWPALLQAFPDAENVLAAAAVRAQEAVALAGETLAIDLPPLLAGDDLQRTAWLQLPPARRRNALRAWLTQRLGRGAPEALVQRLSEELPRCKSGQWVAPGAELRLYRGLLRCAACGVATASAPSQRSAPSAPDPGPVTRLRLDRLGTHPLPGWQGSFIVTPGDATGAAVALLHEVFARARSGGERFQLAPKAMPRSLKKQYQARAVPAWQRGGPLLFDGEGRLLFAPGLGVDAGARAAPGEPGLHIIWVPDPASP